MKEVVEMGTWRVPCVGLIEELSSPRGHYGLMNDFSFLVQYCVFEAQPTLTLASGSPFSARRP